MSRARADVPEQDALDIIRRLTEKQKDVLGLIAINQDLGHSPRTVQALLKKGLIEGYPEVRRFKDGLPPMTVTRYSVPLPVHIAWCQWCDEVVGDDEI